MQQGGGGTQSQYGEMTPASTTATIATATANTTTSTHTTQPQPVESGSPISSRPPSTSVTSNLDEFMRLSGGVDEDEGDRDRGVASGNRWPPQETLALLNIRSDMDAAFRDATVKGPLWEEMSRKLSELGYERSAKKCKEKFENVHKYYKRTKEGRAGRQDGKTYKFFSQLEALHSATSNVSMPVITVTSSNPITLDVAPVAVGIPLPISSARIPTSHSHSTLGISASSMFPSDTTADIPGSNAAMITTTPPTATTTITNKPTGISFSSDSDSSSHDTEDDEDEEEMDFEGQPSNTVGSSRKRKRQSSSNSSTTHRMMEFFKSIMKQVIQKQETMQQRFLEVIEKRERDRMIRDEAWKRQEMARLAREQEVMTQERAISASRDAAIISFLQKITGQTIQLPPAAPPPTSLQQPAPAVVVPAVSFPKPTQHQVTPSSLPQERRNQQNQQLTQSHHRHQQQQLGKSAEMVWHQPASTSIPSQVVMAIPEQQISPSQEIGSSGSFESSSSRWPKVEVLALIKLRSRLEPKYREAGPKGPLWEEISAGMQRIGYNRCAKRCKEKWENINKYFKKVKESNKKRPEDAKTCPYFHELDALYRKKILGGGSGGGGGGTSTSSFNISEEQQPQQHRQGSLKLDQTPAATNPQESSNISTIMPAPQVIPASESDNKNTGSVDAQARTMDLPRSFYGEGNGGASNKPEDIVKELMNQQGMQRRRQQRQPPQQSIRNDFDKIEESNIGSDSNTMEHEEDCDEDEDDDQDELEQERKMAYEAEFQGQNTNTSNGGENGAASFLAMVQ